MDKRKCGYKREGPTVVGTSEPPMRVYYHPRLLYNMPTEVGAAKARPEHRLCRVCKNLRKVGKKG